MLIDSNLEKLLTTKDLAIFLSISKSTVYRLIERREIPFCKVRGSVRFDKKDIKSYLQRNRVESIGLTQYDS